MKIPSSALLITLSLFLLPTSHGLDFDFFQTSACTNSLAHVSCVNVPPLVCCRAGGPWCAYVRGTGLPEGRAMYTYDNAECAGKYLLSCAGPRPPAYCCARVGGGSSGCAAIWLAGGSKKRDDDEHESELSSNCTRHVQPNRMVYTDARGARQAIHLPRGTFDRASASLDAGDFDALARYPAWANQTYDDDDGDEVTE
ncbi:hypothetical protein M432DRAFT_586464 [Thermoascus aurantiacus ATCC 26904]